MLSCLCSLCLGRSDRTAYKVAHAREQPAQGPFPTPSATAAAAAAVGGASDTAILNNSLNDVLAADIVAGATSMTAVAASTLVRDAGCADTPKVYVPLCSPFSTTLIPPGDTSPQNPATQNTQLAASCPAQLGPAPGHAQPESASADGRAASSAAECSSLTPLYHHHPFTSTSSYSGQPTHSQNHSQVQQASSMPAATTTTTSATSATTYTDGMLSPAPLLPGHLFILQQATGSSQSAGGVGTGSINTAGTAPSLPTLPGNAVHLLHNNNNHSSAAMASSNAYHAAHLSTTATLRSDAGPEATARLMPAGGGGGGGDASATLPPVALLISDASTARLVEFLTHDSVDTSAATAAPAGGTGGPGIAVGNSGPASRSPGAVATTASASTGAASGASGAGSRRPGGGGGLLRGVGGASSGFSLFGALQAFVEQQHGDAATAAVVPPAGSAAAAQVQGSQGQGTIGGAADQFRGFDRGSVSGDSQDAPTATLTRVQTATHGSGTEGHRSRRRGDAGSGGGGGGGGGLPQSPLGLVGRHGRGELPRTGTGNGAHHRSSGEWAQDSGAPPEGWPLATGIIIGGGYLATNSSSGAIASGAVVAPAADQQQPSAVAVVRGRGLSRASNAATSDYYDGASGTGCNMPLSGAHSFDGMASLLSGPSNSYFLEDTYRGGGGGGGLAGSTANGAGSDTDSRAENTTSLISGDGGGGAGGGGGGAAASAVAGPRGGGGRSNRRRRMQHTAERREFLSAARSISAVLQDVQILSVLGAGAHGKVYKGALRDRFVAVKVIVHDADVPSVIPPSSLSGLRQVPSNMSLAALDSTVGGAAGTCGDGGGLSSETAQQPATSTAVAGAAGRRGTSGSGARPAVHMLRFQRAGSSNLHALPATLSGGGGGGGGGSQASTSAATAAASLPVLSLPGMPPVVMPHKHMLEGLISASAHHPNITETYRIVTQLVSAPTMPAFVVTRGSQSPLWETTNLNPAAVLRFGNGSVGEGGGGGDGGGGSGGGGGGGGAALRPSAGADGSAAAVGAGAGPGLPRGGPGRAASPGPHKGFRDHVQRANSLGRNREAGGVRSPLSSSSRARRDPSTETGECVPESGVPAGSAAAAGGSGFAGGGGVAAPSGAIMALRAGLRGRGEAPPSSAALQVGRPGGAAWGGSGEQLRSETSEADAACLDGQDGGAPAGNRGGAGGDAAAADCAGEGGEVSQCDSLLSIDGPAAGSSLVGASAGPANNNSAGGGGPLREASTLSVPALARDVGSSGQVSVAGGGDAAFAAASTGSSGRMRQAVAAAAALGGGGSSILSTGPAVLSVSALAQASGGAEVDPWAGAGAVEEDEVVQPKALVANAVGTPQPQPQQDVSQGAGEEPGWSARGSTGPGPTLQDLAGGGSLGGDPDSAELILDLLGAQAAAQRTASFLRRRQQQPQQQASLEAGESRGGGTSDAQGRPLAAGGGDGGGGAAARPGAADTVVLLGIPYGDDGGGAGEGVAEAEDMGEFPRRAGGGGGGGGAARRAGGGMEAVVYGKPLRRSPGAASEVASGGSGRSGVAGGGGGTDSGESPSGDLSTHPYDYMVADDSGLILPNGENFGLATALFSTFRNSYYAGTEYSSVSGRPPPYRFQHMRGSQSSAVGVPGVSSGPGGVGGGSAAAAAAGVRFLPAVAPAAGEFPATSGPGGGPLGYLSAAAAHGGGRDPGLPQIVDSAGSISSAPLTEASLALPAPLQGAAVPAAAAVMTAGTAAAAQPPNAPHGAAAWLPTIDELTAGVGTDLLQQSLPPLPPSGPLLAAQSSAGSTARNSLLRTGSLGSGEIATGGAAAANAAGATRTSNGSAASGAGGNASGNHRLLLGSNATSYGGQLMPADVQYDKLSWSNHTHTSASTSAVMLNSGFTALLSSINNMVTGGGSNPGGGGGSVAMHTNSGLSGGGWRRGDSVGVGVLSRRATLAATTASGTEASAAINCGDQTAGPAASTSSGTYDTTRGAGPSDFTAAAQPSDAGAGGAAAAGTAERELRSLAPVEPMSRSFTDMRSSRGATGTRRRAVAAAAASPPGRERWQVLIVQELCTRGNLRDAISSGAFHSANAGQGTRVIAMRRLLDTAAEIASAMAYLHSRAIVHGDLKTANVLLQREDSDPRGFVAKLADFGLARQLGGRGVEDGLLVSRIGTVTHMAPETIRDNMVLLASDVYSFGVIMWELYCAAQPFANYSAFQLLSAVVQYDERPQFPVHCPPSYASLAVRCMAKNPRERPTFAQVHRELIAIRDGLFGSGGGGVCGGGGGTGVPPGGCWEPGGTITVPLAQARREATRVLQSHLQIVSGPITGGGSGGHASGSLRGGGDASGGGGGGGGGGDANGSGLALVESAARDGSAPGTSPTAPSSVESWDVCSRAERARS